MSRDLVKESSIFNELKGSTKERFFDLKSKLTGLPAALQKIIMDALDYAFGVDFAGVIAASGFQQAFKAKFGALEQFSNIFKINPLNNEHSGKFYMDFPEFMGGKRLCVLDFTWAKPVLDWGKLFIRCGLWIMFVQYVINSFKVRYTVS